MGDSELLVLAAITLPLFRDAGFQRLRIELDQLGGPHEADLQRPEALTTRPPAPQRVAKRATVRLVVVHRELDDGDKAGQGDDSTLDERLPGPEGRWLAADGDALPDCGQPGHEGFEGLGRDHLIWRRGFVLRRHEDDRSDQRAACAQGLIDGHDLTLDLVQ
jgi:hypothetical protein